MIAKGFKPVAWVGAVGTAALACYMLSLQVAAERAELASLEARIVAASRDIRTLQTELGTRGRLQQLEQWNAEVLALSAPGAQQFLDSPLTLARFDAPAVGMDSPAQVRMASAETAPDTAVPAAPMTATAPVRQAVAETPPTAAEPQIRRANLTVPPAAAEAPERPRPAPARATRPATRPAATAAASRPLIDETVMREIGAAARAERDGATRD